VGFARREGVLHGDDVSLEDVATRAGTPTFVYSLSIVRDRIQRLRTALGDVPHTIHYSLKANSNRAILAELKALGCGVDVVSGGELFRAGRAGFGGGAIVFGGVGKTRAELAQALDARVKLINVESEAELRMLAELAAEKGVVAPVGLRINPEVDISNAHRFIATGAKGHKFGIGHGDALAVGKLAITMKSVALVAVDMHVGSQLHSFAAYRDGTARQIDLVRALRKEGAPIKWLDVGGGLPVPYQDEPEPDLNAYAAILRDTAKALGDVEILLEHGRFVVAASGTLLTRVLYRKESGGKTYLVCDAGMTELLRPSHYDAFHRIEPVVEGGAPIVADIVGPVCESGDFLALDRSMADVPAGAVLAVHTAGAYGFVMASHYNARPRAAEVAVDGSRWAVVTARESYEDLVRQEASAPRWEDAR